ncbi:MAG: fumarylacetoacetate hydrolase family protein [Rhodothermales bacterium]
MEECRIPGRDGGADAVYRPGKLVCIGRNYAKHAAELGNAVPTRPMIFLKPASSLVASGGHMVIPSASADVHHEVELVCLIGKAGKDIREDEALDHVAGYAVGLDMTARDIQQQAKEKGHPWSVAKGFDTFAPLGEFVPSDAVPNPQDLVIQLSINGEIRQDGHTRDMIFPLVRLISYASSIFTLMPGDLLFTGTPEGVGPVASGDRLEAQVEGLPVLTVDVR